MAVPLFRPRSQDDDELRRYTYRVVPFWVLFGTVGSAPFYGCNVWIMDVVREFGMSSLWSASQATIVMAFTLGLFCCTLTAAAIGPLLSRFGPRRIYLAGVITSSAALAASGHAVAEKSLLGLYAAWAVLLGGGMGVSYLTVLTCCVSWFRKCGAPGHGAGWFGFAAGVWPALFSYAGPAAVDLVGLENSFHFFALVVLFVGAWPALFICMPDQVQAAPANDTGTESSAEKLEGMETGDLESAETKSTLSPMSTANPSASEVSSEKQAPASAVQQGSASGTRASAPMTRRQVLIMPEFWTLWLRLFLSTLPGFGIKYLIAPMMEKVFGAGQPVHATASFIFLVCYAIARLATGVVVGPFVSARRCFDALVIAQALVCAGVGIFLYGLCGSEEGKCPEHSDHLVWIFVVLIACMGSTLAGLKVVMPLLSLELGGPVNLGVVQGLMSTSIGTASFLGPVSSWMALAAVGGVSSSPAVAAWFCASSGATLLAALLGQLKQRSSLTT